MLSERRNERMKKVLAFMLVGVVVAVAVSGCKDGG